MSLREQLQHGTQASQQKRLAAFGILANPYPTSNQTTGNPHLRTQEDDEAEARILTFLREGRSEVLVVLGTQGVGKTNFLNNLESELQEAKAELDGYYIVRYMADPEPSFDGIISHYPAAAWDFASEGNCGGTYYLKREAVYGQILRPETSTDCHFQESQR